MGKNSQCSRAGPAGQAPGYHTCHLISSLNLPHHKEAEAEKVKELFRVSAREEVGSKHCGPGPAPCTTAALPRGWELQRGGGVGVQAMWCNQRGVPGVLEGEGSSHQKGREGFSAEAITELDIKQEGSGQTKGRDEAPTQSQMGSCNRSALEIPHQHTHPLTV